MEKQQFIAVTAAATACAMQETHVAPHSPVQSDVQRHLKEQLWKQEANPLPLHTLCGHRQDVCFDTGLSLLSPRFLALFWICAPW